MTVLLIGVCGLAFVYHDKLAGYGAGFIPVDFIHSLLHPATALSSSVITLFMSFFLHANITHLVSNMWYLWIFGSALEYTIGTFRFGIVYLACGVLSMIIQAASTPFSAIPIVGASGAIAGIMGAYLVLLPFSRIIVWFPPVFFFRIPAFIFLVLWFGIQYMSMRVTSSSNIAWWAHIGGYGAGFIIAIELKRRRLHNGRVRRKSRPQQTPSRK